MARILEVMENGRVQKIFVDRYHDWALEFQGGVIIVRARNRETGEAVNVYVAGGIVTEHEHREGAGEPHASKA